MAVDGFARVEFFAYVGAIYQSLSVQLFRPSSDAAGTTTIDRTIGLFCGSAIGEVGGVNEFRAVLTGYGGTSSTDKLTGFPGVSWQVDGTTPTETAVAQAVSITISPRNA